MVTAKKLFGACLPVGPEMQGTKKLIRFFSLQTYIDFRLLTGVMGLRDTLSAVPPLLTADIFRSSLVHPLTPVYVMLIT